MSYTLAMQQKPSQNIKQLQRLIMSRRMQQAIHLLQMPVAELSMAVQLELQQNPLLEYPDEEIDDQDGDMQRLSEDADEVIEEEDIKPEEELKFDEQDFEALQRLDEGFRDYLSDVGEAYGKVNGAQEKTGNFLENTVCSVSTLFEHLMQQAKETFEEEREIALAEALIGNFDENGYLKTPIEEIAVLQGCRVDDLEKLLDQIQTFEPKGVGARNLRESLLIQLRSQGKESTLAYAIVDKCFDDLLHNRIPRITTSLACTAEQIGEMVDRHIAKLDLHPGSSFSRRVVQNIIPDAVIRLDDDKLIAAVNEEALPSLRLNSRYLRMLRQEGTAADVKDFIRQKLVSAKWLLRNIYERNSTVEKITSELAKRQHNFFSDPEGKLVPLTMKVIAEELQLHESTIARAISDKYIDTPRGLFPLRFFFTNAIENEAGKELSSRTVRDLVREIIASEDKSSPLSDEAVSAMIAGRGIRCARRTVAKYRAALKIGTAQQRRKFKD